MGSYEREQQMIADKTALRGETARRDFAIDGAAVYNMLVKLRTQPEIANKVLNFRPTCYQGGCGSKDAGFDLGYYN